MKIIFLDIDGVLGTWESLSKPWYVWQHLNSKSVEALNFITRNTSAKIVISSTWRLGDEKTFASLIVHLKNEGIEAKIIGRTPMLNRLRGLEIQKWLDDFDGEVESFVILDDDDDMCHLSDHLVWIENGLENGGLNFEYAKWAVEILKQ